MNVKTFVASLWRRLRGPIDRMASLARNAAFYGALVCVAILSGCGDRDDFGFVPGEPAMLRVGGGAPRLSIQAYPFEGELFYPDRVHLDSSSELVFCPLVCEKSGENTRLEAYLVVDGRERLLYSGPPLYVKDDELAEHKIRQILAAEVRVDLSAYQGMRGAIRWVCRDGGSSRRGAVAGLKILPRSPSAPKKPHILFVCTDTLRYDYALGERGRRLMPELAELAERAVTYHCAVSSASWTMPSLASTLTGLSPRYHKTGFRTATLEKEDFDEEQLPPGRFVFAAGNKCRILTVYPNQLKTFTEYLQEAGYTTGLIASNPLYFLSGLYADGQDLAVKTGVVAGSEVNAAAAEVIANRPEGRPLFLLVHYMDVHQWKPWYFDKLAPESIPSENRDALIASYTQAVRDSDLHLGRLLDLWEQEIGLEESMVVFYSDHGEHLLDTGRPLTGHGNSMDEVLLHIPLVIRYPRAAEIASGDRFETVSLLDLPATVLDLLGITPEAGTCQGFSLLRSVGEQDSTERFLFADSQLYGDEMASVREGPFKLVLNLDSPSVHLLDLRVSPAEAGEPGQVVDDQQIFERLSKAYEEYLHNAKITTAGLASDLEVDQEEALRGLRELGYVK